VRSVAARHLVIEYGALGPLRFTELCGSRRWCVMSDATTTRRQLVTELRRLRSLAQVNQRQVAEALDWSPSKIYRIEKGDVSISVTDLRALLGYYGVLDRSTVEELVELAKGARRPLPFSTYRDVLPPEAIRFFGYEAVASSLVVVQNLVAPGLLQTDEYACALLGGVMGMERARVDRFIASRRERQRLLTATPAPRVTFFLDESVLTRVIGDAEIQLAQLQRLQDVVDARPHVTIRILPLNCGGHVGLRGTFVYLTFPEPNDPDVVYVEGRRGDTLFRDEPEVAGTYRRSVEQLESVASQPSELPEYLQMARERIVRPPLVPLTR
jgi:transcriptional regulator with XRE-family HTH domain